jgi:Protein of unknown function (DUF2961)
MFKWLAMAVVLVLPGGTALASSPAAGRVPEDPSAAPIYMISNAESRSISPENLTGGKGMGARTELKDGSAGHAAKPLGKGWKVNPFMLITPGQTLKVGEVTGSGVVEHIWMTLGGGVDYRSVILRIYWDDEPTPSVESPVGDFFASGWGRGNEPLINSQAVAVNPGNGFNSFWPMPFRKKFKITLENRGTHQLGVFYSINYALQAVPKDAAYFHAQFRQADRVKAKDVYTLLDGVKGRGQYVGSYISHGAYGAGWWGEGEMKFYLDGDVEFPTIAGTGEEDYFLGSYDYGRRDASGVWRETNFSALYSGFYSLKPLSGGDPEYFQEGLERRVGEYRWHLRDPIRFRHDLRVTIQDLGWEGARSGAPIGGATYRALEDYLASVAYWYQAEPHAPFPALPNDEALQLAPVPATK